MLALGGMLIYSLLLNDVEAKTYEYGMLRGLGMRQYVLIELLLTQVWREQYTHIYIYIYIYTLQTKLI